MSEEEIGTVPTPQSDAYGELQQYYPFNQKQLMFLEEYSKDLDTKRAAKAVGYKARYIEEFRNQHKALGQAMTREMQRIQRDWIKAIRLNAKSSAAKHIEIFEKIEADYDIADLETKSKFAGTLAKLSDTSLKATGQFAQEKVNSGVKVEVNIDLSSNDPKTIEAEVIDVEET